MQIFPPWMGDVNEFGVKKWLSPPNRRFHIFSSSPLSSSSSFFSPPLSFFLTPLVFFFFHIGFHAVHAGLELAVYLRQTLNFWSSCFDLPSAGITGKTWVTHHTWLMQSWQVNPGIHAWEASTLPQDPHSLTPFLCFYGSLWKALTQGTCVLQLLAQVSYIS